MIGPDELVTGVVAGCFLMLLGLVPGLFQGLVHGAENFLNLVSSGMPVGSDLEVEQPKWLSGAGTALIVITVLAYVST